MHCGVPANKTLARARLSLSAGPQVAKLAVIVIIVGNVSRLRYVAPFWAAGEEAGWRNEEEAGYVDGGMKRCGRKGVAEIRKTRSNCFIRGQKNFPG